MLGEAVEVSDAPLPDYNDDYKPLDNPNDIRDKGLPVDDATKERQESYNTAYVLKKAADTFQYVTDEMLYQFINKPEDVVFDTLDISSNVADKVVNVHMVVTEQLRGNVKFWIEETIKVCSKTISDRLKSSFKVTYDFGKVNMAHMGFNKITCDVVIEMTKLSEDDIDPLDNFATSTSKEEV